jgi:hypothetical protein
MTGALRTERTQRDIHAWEGCAKMEAATGVKYPHAKEC